MIVLVWQPTLSTAEDLTQGHKIVLCTFGANPNACELVIMCVVRILAVLYYSKRHGLLASFPNE